jgi:hypothetical protein
MARQLAAISEQNRELRRMVTSELLPGSLFSPPPYGRFTNVLEILGSGCWQTRAGIPCFRSERLAVVNAYLSRLRI